MTKPTLLADTPAVYCDLVHICDPAMKQAQSEDLAAVAPNHGVLALDVQVATYSNGHLLELGTYIFHLTVAASNCHSVHYVLEVSYSGNWSPEEREMFHEFKMKPPERVKRGPRGEG